MRWFLLPFFVIRLLVHLAPFVFQLILLVLQPYLGLLVVGTIVVIYTIALANSLWTRYHQRQQAHSPTPSTSVQFELLQEKINTGFSHRTHLIGTPELASATTEIDRYWQLSPTHRDLAINKAILAAQVQDEKAAQQHLDQARRSDPQFSLFTQE